MKLLLPLNNRQLGNCSFREGFKILDLFENNSENEKAIAILTSQDFKKDLKEFFVSQSFNQEDFN